MASFVAFGNPLTDISVEIENDVVLKKYGLEDDFQAELELEKFEALFAEVQARFQDYPDMSVGRCVCLVRGKNRCLVANIGSAGHFSVEYLKESQELQDMINGATLIHVEGFFLSNRFATCQYLIEEVKRNRNKTISYNLAAPYVIQTLSKESKYMAENSDIVFGNDAEFKNLGTLYGLGSAEECALKLHELWFAESKPSGVSHMARFGKIIVVTDNCNPVLVVWGDSQPARKQRFQVPKLDPDRIVDTTGAGDAFFAGFIYGLMTDRPLEVCIKFACKIAATVIGYVGTAPPDGHKLPTIEDCDVF